MDSNARAAAPSSISATTRWIHEKSITVSACASCGAAAEQTGTGRGCGSQGAAEGRWDRQALRENLALTVWVASDLCERWRAWPFPPHAEGSLHRVGSRRAFLLAPGLPALRIRKWVALITLEVYSAEIA